MGAIPPIEFIKYFVEQGYDFKIRFFEHGEISDEVVMVNNDNIDDFAKKLENSQKEDT